MEFIYYLKQLTPELKERLDPGTEYLTVLGIEDMSFSGAHLKEKASKHISHLVVPVKIDQTDLELCEEMLNKHLNGFFQDFDNEHPMKNHIVNAMVEALQLSRADLQNQQVANVQHLRTQFFLDNTELEKFGNNTGPPKFVVTPHTVFEWFKPYIKTV